MGYHRMALVVLVPGHLCQTSRVQGFSSDSNSSVPAPSEAAASSTYASDTYGESFADVYDRWYPDVSDTEGTTSTLLGLAGDGLIIELGIGTGRLALPLAATGCKVRGVDSSSAMLEELALKPGAEQIEVVQGDMASVPLGDPGEASLVFVAFNTFFNLPSAHDQRKCFGLVAEVLTPGGRFVVETFVAPDPNDLPSRGLSTHSVDVDRVVLTATQTDPDAQVIRGQHIDITNGDIRLRPWLLRFASIGELDDMATSAGFVLESRHADWRGSEFGPQSETHVSVYQNMTSEI